MLPEPILNGLLKMQDVSLIYQLIGALLLGYALVVTSDYDIKRIVTKDDDFNRDMLRSLVAERTNGRFGICLLILGYAIPLALAILPIPANKERMVGLVLLIVLGFILFAYVITKIFFEKRTLKKLHVELQRET